MTPPVDSIQTESKPKEDSLTSILEGGSFRNLEELVNYEEQNVLDLLDVALKISPKMFGNDGLKKSKSGEIKICTKARQKVIDYYRQILWGEVGNYLEHIILWWGASPLALRPPHSSQHLRQWILQFIPMGKLKYVF